MKLHVTDDTNGPYIVLADDLYPTHRLLWADLSNGHRTLLAGFNMVAVGIRAVGGDWGKVKGLSKVEAGDLGDPLDAFDPHGAVMPALLIARKLSEEVVTKAAEHLRPLLGLDEATKGN